MILSVNGFHYYVYVVNTETHFNWVYLLLRKSQVYETFVKFQRRGQTTVWEENYELADRQRA